MFRLTVFIERGESVAIARCRAFRRLRALLLRSRHEGWSGVEAVGPAVGAGQLAIDKYAAARVLAAGGLWIGRNDAVADRLDAPAFISGELAPLPWPYPDRRTAP